jgi:hypothetical protein
MLASLSDIIPLLGRSALCFFCAALLIEMGFMVCGCSPVYMRVSAILYLTKTLYQNPGFDLLPDRHVQDIRSKCGVELHSSSTRNRH